MYTPTIYFVYRRNTLDLSECEQQKMAITFAAFKYISELHTRCAIVQHHDYGCCGVQCISHIDYIDRYADTRHIDSVVVYIISEL